MKDFTEIKLFKNKNKDYTFEDLVKEIYIDTNEKKSTIQQSINSLLKQLTAENASPRIIATVAQLLPQYFEKDIKNSQQLTVLASIVQRFNQKNESSGKTIEDTLTEEEKADLISAANSSDSIPGEST